MITPGAEWREEIEKALASAKAAVLLVTPDYLGSNFIVNNELPPLLEAAKNGGCQIFRINVADSIVLKTSLGKYQALYEKPALNTLHRAARGTALSEIANRLSQLTNQATS
jgi:internalin A